MKDPEIRKAKDEEMARILEIIRATEPLGASASLMKERILTRIRNYGVETERGHMMKLDEKEMSRFAPEDQLPTLIRILNSQAEAIEELRSAWERRVM